MNKIKSSIALLFALLVCLSFSACGDDKDEPTENTPDIPVPEATTYVDVDYQLTCSEDLLQYVTPRVTYTDNDGTTKTVDISDSEWEENEEIEFYAEFKNGKLNAKIMTWTKRVRYTKFPVDKEMTVKYVPKANMPAYDKTRVNKFYHFPSVYMKYVSEGKSILGSKYTKNVSYTNKYKTIEEIISEYVNDLCIPYISQIDNNSCIVIGADNQVITDIISSYNDKQGIIVQNDGTNSIKYDEEPCATPKPYCDVTYTLNCSEEFLKYVTPQVTYIGNDGNPVTFQIAESEFELNEDLNTWATHIHGDEDKTYADGEEKAKIMKWTKHVHYDDISTVDDEMTVTYIPKDGIENLRLSHVYHNLSAAFLLLNDHEVTTMKSFNKVNTNMVEGEKKMGWTWETIDGNGFYYSKKYIIKDFIGNLHIEYIDSDGNLVQIKFSDLIISSYKDHQGFHLESNGKFSQM